MIVINLFKSTGSFAEDKDLARELRIKEILPALSQDKKVILDFTQVEFVTQSFIHALISDLIRKYNSAALEKVQFKNCNNTIKKVIEIVTDYMQQID